MELRLFVAVLWRITLKENTIRAKLAIPDDSGEPKAVKSGGGSLCVHVINVEIRLEGGRKLAVGVVYINPEGVRVDKTEEQFEGIEDEVVRLQ